MTDAQPHGREAPTGAGTYSSAMSDAGNYIGWIISAFEGVLEPPILEIGVGHGSYAETLRTRGRYVGVDIDRESVDLARRRFPDSAFLVADITQPDFVETVGENRMGCVICLNVLEHIGDHETSVVNLARVLRPGGHLGVVVPALPMLTNDLDRLAGHLRRYRLEDLAPLARAAGIELVRLSYFNPVGGLGWWANRLVRHESLNETAVNSQIRLFDKYAVPLSKAIDPLTRRFFGQSILMLARKP